MFISKKLKEKKQADDRKKKATKEKASGLRRSNRMLGIEPVPILPSSSGTKDEDFMNDDAARVQASRTEQPVSKSFSLVDSNPRLVSCNIPADEVTLKVWTQWVEKSGKQDPELHVYHPNVVRFATKLFKTDDLTRAMLIDSSLRLHFLKSEVPFYYAPNTLLSPEQLFPLALNPDRSIEFYPGMDEIRLYEGEIENPDMTFTYDYDACMLKRFNVVQCELTDSEYLKRMNDSVFMDELFAALL